MYNLPQKTVKFYNLNAINAKKVGIHSLGLKINITIVLEFYKKYNQKLNKNILIQLHANLAVIVFQIALDVTLTLMKINKSK